MKSETESGFKVVYVQFQRRIHALLKIPDKLTMGFVPYRETLKSEIVNKIQIIFLWFR